MAAQTEAPFRTGVTCNLSVVWSATLEFSFNVLKIGNVFK